MADVFLANKYLKSGDGKEAIFVLVSSMVSAGWAPVESSTGTGSVVAGNSWTSYPALQTNAWIVLAAPSGRQIVFRLSSSTGTGWLVWCPYGGYSAGSATVSSPGPLPGTSVFLRGTGAAPSTFSSATSLLGAASATSVSLAVRDTATSEDFWAISQAESSSLRGSTGRLIYARVEHSGLSQVDPLPYAWHVHSTATYTWSTLSSTSAVSTSDSSSSGYWRRIWNAGQSGSAIKTYGVSVHMPTAGSTSTSSPLSSAETAKARHQASARTLGFRMRLTKVAEAGFPDPDGGAIQGVLLAEITGIKDMTTANSGQYVKIGPFWLWWSPSADNIQEI